MITVQSNFESVKDFPAWDEADYVIKALDGISLALVNDFCEICTDKWESLIELNNWLGFECQDWLETVYGLSLNGHILA